MAPIKSQNSNMLLAFLTLLGKRVSCSPQRKALGIEDGDSSCFAKVLKLYRDRLKLPNIAFQVKFRDVYWNFA